MTKTRLPMTAAAIARRVKNWLLLEALRRPTREQVAGVVVWALAALAAATLLVVLAVGLWRFGGIADDDGWAAALRSVDLRGMGLAAGGIATMVGVAIAALVGYYKFQLFREGRPHLTIELTASHRRVSPGFAHIGAIARLSNTSKVVVIVSTATWNLTAIAPYTEAAAERLRQDFVRGYRYDGDEFGTSLQKQVCSQFYLNIEPGETDEVTLDFIVQSDLESVAITLFIDNDAESSETNRVVWGRRIFYDLAD